MKMFIRYLRVRHRRITSRREEYDDPTNRYVVSQIGTVTKKEIS